MAPREFLTLKEVAGLLRLSPQTVYRMVKAGRLPAVKVGSQWRFERARLEAFLRPAAPAGTLPAPDHLKAG